MRFCVIGAGAAGICAARRLLQAVQHQKQDDVHFGEDTEIRVFEQCDQLGGTWVLDESGQHNQHSSMYADLRTNIPREVMQFDYFPFLADFPLESSYPGHEKVLAYLQRFAQPIQHLIQFNTRMISVRHLPDSQAQNWAVKFQQNNGQIMEEHFDVLFACSGQFADPRLPPFVHKLVGLPWLHSHNYRRAELYAGKTVAVVGAGLSGVDIALQLADHAKKVYLLHMSSSPQPKIIADDAAECTGPDIIFVPIGGGPSPYWTEEERPANVEELCRVVDVTEDSLMLEDGTELGIKQGLDVVIFCTGYRYSFPYLEAEGLIRCPDDGAYVSPMWAHFAHVQHPRSLFLLNLNLLVTAFQQSDAQTRAAIALIQGRAKPPPLSEMLAEEEARLCEIACKGQKTKMYHIVLVHYLDRLDELAGRAGWRPPVFGKLAFHCKKVRQHNRTNKYRNVRYLIKNEREFEFIQFGDEEDECGK